MITAQALIDKFQYALDNKWGYIWGKAGQIWTKAQQDAATREQTVKYGSKWIGHHVADCSGLFAWAFKELGGYMYHGSNTMYRDYCTSKGKLTGNELEPGTAVFTGTEDDHGHVGLYIGDGWVIEAKGTNAGVVKTSINDKRWTYWGWLKGVDEGGEPMPDYRPTLRRGDKGPYVTLAQTELKQKGYDLGKWGIDGDFGRATESAVLAFQKNNGLVQDGVIGPRTWELLESTEMILYTITIPHLTQTQAEELQKQYPAGIITKE